MTCRRYGGENDRYAGCRAGSSTFTVIPPRFFSSMPQFSSTSTTARLSAKALITWVRSGSAKVGMTGMAEYAIETPPGTLR
ncbi:hypothetical protein NEUTE2DRAFT_170696 [Neurospora tetrasperma FGSC 2509]|nr:hypothetical protein NEUTE2DRAFT_170696 [Neurospora tetrasperma FGSC 2509]